MTTKTEVTLEDLVARLRAMPEDLQLYYAYAVMELIDYDEKFDALIESTPKVLEELSKHALAEHRAGRTRPLTDEDFALDHD